jgi:hypothetical protein
MYYLPLEYANDYSEYLYDLLVIKLFMNRGELPDKVKVFYQNFFKQLEDRSLDSVGILYYFERDSFDFYSNFSIDTFDQGDFVTVTLELTDDCKKFITYDYLQNHENIDKKTAIDVMYNYNDWVEVSMFEESLEEFESGVDIKLINSPDDIDADDLDCNTIYLMNIDLVGTIDDLFELDLKLSLMMYEDKLERKLRQIEPIPYKGIGFFLVLD